jgi:hypothetical protein
MIRRNTWIVFGIFIGIAMIGIFLMKSPASPLKPAAPTSEATVMPKLIQNITDKDVTLIELHRAIGGTTRLTRNPDGTWTNPKVGFVPAGKVEEIISELLGTNRVTELPANYSLESLYLVKPGQTITIGTAQKTIILKIGGMTPTIDGYYTRVDNGPPGVVNKNAIEGVFALFDSAQTWNITPTTTLSTPTP